MRSLYVKAARRLSTILTHAGLVSWLDRHAASSRWATWLRSLFAIFDVQDLARLDVPWWTFAAADRVAEFLEQRPEARVFEWGSGASTLWLARRTSSHVTSIEHDSVFADSLRPMLPDNVTLHVVKPRPTSSPAVGSKKKGFESLDFSAYVTAIEGAGDPFDLIVIDGRAREACLPIALRHLAPRGLVVFDNVDRRRYRDALSRERLRLGEVTITRGLTPALPYPTRTALLSGR